MSTTAISLVPQTELYTMFDTKNPLYKLALTYPKNMCWLTTIFYAAQFLGFSNDKKLNIKSLYTIFTLKIRSRLV